MENNNTLITEIEDNKCLICWDSITCNTWARCFGCNILLHDKCETIYRTINNRNHCLCPHCHRVGTLGRIYRGGKYVSIND